MVDNLKKKAKKKLFLVVLALFGPLFSIIGGLLVFILITTGDEVLMPDIEPDLLNELQRTSSQCGVSWQDLLAYITVYYQNDFEELTIDDIDTIIADFLIVTYDKYVEEITIVPTKMPYETAVRMGYQNLDPPDENGLVEVDVESSEWVLEGSNTLESFFDIVQFSLLTGNPSNNGVVGVVNHIRLLDDTPEYDTYVSSKETRDFFDRLSEEQIEWYSVLVSEGILLEITGEYFELPEEIIVETSGYFAWPIPGVTRITSQFGWRDDPVYEVQAFHEGLDVGSVIGTPVIAAADGRVIMIQHKTSGYGNNIQIEHEDAEGNIWITRYAHLHQIEVEMGEEVSRGHVIGASGNSGKSTGPHLHFEIKYEGTPVDPLLLVDPN